MAVRKVKLKVSTAKGQRIIASVEWGGGRFTLQIPYLEEVEKDNPPFSKDGVIKISSDMSKYDAIKAKVTKYLEDLFLKGLQDANSNTGSGNGGNTRGAKGKATSRGVPKSERENGDTLPNSGGRSKSSEGNRAGNKSSNVAKGSDKKSS